MSAPVEISTRVEPFDRQAVEVLGNACAALSAAIGALPGEVRRAADVQKITKLDTKLSWRLFKAARAASPLLAGPYVPSHANIQTFLRAAARAGVPGDILAAVEHTSRDLENFISAYAGDRSTFDSMVTALARGGDADHGNLQHRRAAFRANRHIWGVQAAMQVKCVFVDIGDDPSQLNLAAVEGHVALKQLRPDAPLYITSTPIIDDDGAPLPVACEGLDPHAANPHGLALVRPFCSSPVPELRNVRAAGGLVCGELVSRGIGNRGALTCFTGWHARNAASRYRESHYEYARADGAVRVPCEAITICLLLRAGVFGGARPSVSVYGDHLAELPYPDVSRRLDRLLLPEEQVAYLGRGANSLATPELPCLPELANWVFERLGWDGVQFDVYRCRVAYPPLPATVTVSVPLPSAPSALCG
jgi:hypothetical protein